MMQTPILITVRYSSTRLPGKCLIQIQEKSILQHLIERLQRGNLNPIVCTSTDESDNSIELLAKKLNVDCFRGDLQNKILRWEQCAKLSNSDYFHIIDADDPLIDVDEIKESIKEATNDKLDLLKTSNRSDSGYASVGLTIKSTFLNTLSERTKSLSSSDLDVIPWGLLLTEGDRVSVKRDNILIPDSALKLRLTLDYEEDLIVISKIIRDLGNSIKRIELEKYLESKPNLVNINAARTIEFLENKKRQLQDNFNLG